MDYRISGFHYKASTMLFKVSLCLLALNVVAGSITEEDTNVLNRAIEGENCFWKYHLICSSESINLF